MSATETPFVLVDGVVYKPVPHRTEEQAIMQAVAILCSRPRWPVTPEESRLFAVLYSRNEDRAADREAGRVPEESVVKP
jgi:hypothetical protein